MRKIQHGFIAIAILGGPASFILAHQKLTATVPQDASNPFDVAAIVQQAYSRCCGSSAGCQTLTMRGLHPVV